MLLDRQCFCLSSTWNNDANYLFPQEAVADTCRTFRMSYFMDGGSTLQRSAPGKECFKGNKGAIYARGKASSNSQWINTLL